jgi:hypothetical protein
MLYYMIFDIPAGIRYFLRFDNLMVLHSSAHLQPRPQKRQQFAKAHYPVTYTYAKEYPAESEPLQT